MKKFLAGLTFGILLTFTSSVFANNFDIKILDLSFLVNGNNKSITQKPLLINNVTYLPVRDVGNILGFNVVYNADQKSIEFLNNQIINKTPTKPPIDTTNTITTKDLHDKYDLQFVTSANKPDTMEIKSNGNLLASYSIKELSENGNTKFTYSEKAINVYLENGVMKLDKAFVDLINNANNNIKPNNHYLLAREILEILYNKYPDQNPSFYPDNKVIVGDKTIHLDDFTTNLKGINYYNVQVLIDEGLLTENDLIFNK